MRIETDTAGLKALTACFEIGVDGLGEVTATRIDDALCSAVLVGDRAVIEIPDELDRDLKDAFGIGWEGMGAWAEEELALAGNAVAKQLGLQPSFTRVRRAMGRLRGRAR